MSISNQTFKDIEILLINDGSTDNSKDICYSFLKQDKRIRLFNKKNGGLSDARNLGIYQAKGEYIVFVDSDDYIEPSYVQELYTTVQKNKADMAVCEYNLVDEKGNFLKRQYLNELQNINNISGQEMIKYIFKDNYVANVVAWNKIYKTKLLKQNYYPKNRLFEDEFLIIPLLWNTRKISLLRKSLYNYVQRNGSIMKSALTSKKIIDMDAFRLNRINFLQQRDKKLYIYATQDYKEWILDIIGSDLIKNNPKKIYYFKKQYKKYINFKQPKSWKYLLQDVLGYFNIKWARNIRNLKRDIWNM